MDFSCFCFRGDDFRTDYANLAMLCATFPNVPVVALIATASKKDIDVIKQLLEEPFRGNRQSKSPQHLLRKSFS